MEMKHQAVRVIRLDPMHLKRPWIVGTVALVTIHETVVANPVRNDLARIGPRTVARTAVGEVTVADVGAGAGVVVETTETTEATGTQETTEIRIKGWFLCRVNMGFEVQQDRTRFVLGSVLLDRCPCGRRPLIRWR